MAIPAPDSTLAAIQQKVRRLTRSPSQNQLTDTDLQNYINTFVLYDFPEHIRTFNFRTQFSFVCNPFQDVYNLDTASYGANLPIPPSGAMNFPLYDFDNNYLTIHEPLYIAGYQQFYSQSPTQFFGIYPQTNSIGSIGFTGNGSTFSFMGVIQIPLGQPVLLNSGLTNQQITCLIKNNVLFSSIDINGNGVQLVDVPCLDSTTGLPTVWGTLYDPNVMARPNPVLLTSPYLPGTPVTNVPTEIQIAGYTRNYINYQTGAFSITFTNAPGDGQIILSQTIPATVGLPQAMLFYDGQLTLRPVPDQPYTINFEVYIRPTYFMSTAQQPQLQEYWQYIAYGAAKKIFEDRMDMDSVNLIVPEFKKQQNLILRRTIVQNTNERVATIYTEQTSFGAGNGWGWGGGGGTF
jgi:hypothetical protein